MNITIIKKPSHHAIASFVEQQKELPFTYQNIGASARVEQVPHFNNDYQKLPVGRGNSDFELAKKALQNWVHFPQHWTCIESGRVNQVAATDPQTDVCLLFNLFGMWWKNGCRIVYRTEAPNKFGFGYGTLPSHIEIGEELFQVEMDAEGVVWYEIRAFSRPRFWLIRLVKPLARLLQEKFRRDSLEAVRRYVGSGGEITQKSVWRPDSWILALLFVLVGAIFTFPGTFYHHDYGKPVLMFAALLVTPALLHLLDFYQFLEKESARWLPLLFPAGCLLAVSQLVENRLFASVLTIFWLGLSVGFALRQMLDTSIVSRALRWGVRAALWFWVVGAAWAVADPAGIRLFDFSDEITRLTAIHFHFAGLSLTVIAVLAQYFSPSNFGKISLAAVLLGVPMTALGITFTQIGAGLWLENLAGVSMSAAGLAVGWQLLRGGFERSNYFLSIAGITLSFTMLLAAGYALRSILPFQILNLNEMRAIHGTLNAVVAIPAAIWGYAHLSKNTNSER